jgi:hypothetical protein
MKPFVFLILFGALAHGAWKPVEGKISTPWAKDVSPERVWAEYPRPTLKRENWRNLNGLWSYSIGQKDAEVAGDWEGEILVPFAVEAALSGVGRELEPDQSLWYKRTFEAIKKPGKRVLLHFEAVDYEATVWLNGSKLGSHVGGHTPFSFDITEALKEGENEVMVRVHDATSGFQLVGKQHLRPNSIWYTRVSGIWQTVWIEEVNERAISNLVFTSDIKSGKLGVEIALEGSVVEGERYRVEASYKGKLAGRVEGTGKLSLQLSNPKLWSPDTPHLYDLKVELLDAQSKVIDAVTSYAALREVGKSRDKNGNLRFTLNGEPIFHWGPLDQGWWPDGLLTPPSVEAMVSDIDYLKAAGFNMIRKHIKVEPRLYYAHCDKVGMMVWQDQVCAVYEPNAPRSSITQWIGIGENPTEGVWPEEAHQQFVTEYKRMVDHLRHYPSIVVWTPFNEAWGQHRSLEVGRMAVDYDKTRAINVASGGNFWPVGDIADAHSYPDPSFPTSDKRFNDYVKVVGEFGGHGWPVKDHLWDSSKKNWGYGNLPQSLDEWKERYTRSIRVLQSLKRQGVSGGVYTQTTDVEIEINGLLTYDRVEKVPASWLRPLSEALLATPDSASYTTILATSEDQAQEWKFTTEKPTAGWEASDFDAGNWKIGRGGFGSQGTPHAKIGTEWTTPSIWLRREFNISSKPKGRPVLRIHHDEDATVFLNGVQIAKLTGFTTNYTILDLDERAAAALKAGRNVLAIEVKQTEGGQYIDAGILDETEL